MEDVPQVGIEDVGQVPEDGPGQVLEEQRPAEGQRLSSGDSSDEEDGSLLLLLLDSPGDAGPREAPQEPAAAAVTQQDYARLLERLLEQRDEALSRSRELQAELPLHLKRNSRNFGGLDPAEQQHLYEQNLETLRRLREQLLEEARRAQQQSQELALRCRQKKQKVGADVCVEEPRGGAQLLPLLLRWTPSGAPSWPRRRRRPSRSCGAAWAAAPPAPRWTPSWRRSAGGRRSWSRSG